VHLTLSAITINQAQFVITTGRMKYSKYCLLFQNHSLLMPLELSHLYAKTDNTNKSYIPHLVYEMFCAMWACGETNRTGEFQRCKCILFEVRNSIFYSFVQDFPAIDSLNTAFSESFRQEQSTGEKFRLTPHT
jgi:hypothetical protein